MRLEAPKSVVPKSQQQTFDFLSDVKNFEKLMPDSIQKFEVIDTDRFLFALKGMPEIILKKKAVIYPSKIVLGAAGGKLDFSLIANINALSETSSEVHLIFEGEFNAMMAMMIKKPISKFIETLSRNLTQNV